MKKLLAILLAVLMLATLAACGNKTDTNSGSGAASGGETPPSSDGAQSSGGPKYMDAITILGEANIAAVDPYSPSGSGGVNRAVYSCVYDRLIALVEGKFVPELATSWDVADAQVYTFDLRDDVTFHNGEKFTAQSVVDTFTVAREGVGSTGFEVWRPVDTVTALEEYKVQITLNDPNADFLYKISTTGGSIVSKAARDADSVKGVWVGTGAYYVSDYPSPDMLTITRNNDYWGAIAPTREISFRYLPEVAARTIALQTGEAQISFNIGPNDMEWFEKSPDFYVYSFTSNVINTVGFNMNDPITGDKNFRLAVAHAINPQEIAVASSGDYAIAVTDGAVWGWGTQFKNSDIPMPAFDLDLAKEYLAKSNYNGEEIEIISGNPDVNRGAEMIQEQLGKIGIKLRLYQTDHVTLAAHTSYDNNQSQMIHYLNVFDFSGGSARAIFYPGGVWNMASYNNEKVNELLERAPTIADEAARAAVYKEVQEIVAEDVPYIGVYFSVRCITCIKGVGGIILDPDLNHFFRGVYIEVDG